MSTAIAPNPRTAGEQALPLCFAIGPYGAPGSQTRQWSDFVFTKVIAPVLGNDYLVQRTIDRPEPGEISARIERDLRQARLVIADLTDANPNVYFELGFRHAIERPFIHLARAGTALPFDIADFEVIWIHADYVKAAEDSQSYYTIRDDNLAAARSALRGQMEGIAERPLRPTDPFSAKVYRWEMWYSPSIATDWLAAQPESFREQVRAYEHGGGADPIAENSLAQFAEYLALKSAACQSGEGTIFATVNNVTGRLDFGYAAFKFSTAPEPILINVRDVNCSGDCVAAISFEQSSRPFAVERGGRTVSVTIPGYKYTLKLATTNANGGFTGTINHPRTSTKIGDAELTPRYGDFLG
jgi:hypothetical protein